MIMKRILLVLLLLPASTSLYAYTIELSSHDIEKTVARYFPVTTDTPLYLIKIEHPKVILKTDSRRIGLRLHITVKLPDILSTEGIAVIDGDIDYNPVKGEFYLRNPALVSFDATELPAAYSGLVKDAIDMITRQQLPVMLIYQLGNNDLREIVAKRTLKSVEIKEGKVFAELDW